jgi:hypothetical protein
LIGFVHWGRLQKNDHPRSEALRQGFFVKIPPSSGAADP